MKFKICFKCKKEKSIDKFVVDKTIKSGYKASCNECLKLRSKLYWQKWSAKYRKEINQEHLNRYYKNREIYIAKMIEYNNLHAVEQKIYHDQYYIDHKEEQKIRTNEYAKTPIGKLIKINNVHNRRIKQLNSSKLTTEKIEQTYLKTTFNDILHCCLCYTPILNKNEEEIEHDIPISRYQDFLGVDLNSLGNLGIAHISCNRKKSDKTCNEWFGVYPEYLERKQRLYQI